MEYSDVRWVQRFQHYEQAFLFLDGALKKESVSDIERMGIIQSFEVCFELGWKVLKDILLEGGQVLASPRDVIKQAAQNSIITDAELWLRGLEDRNLSTHTYDEATARSLEARIRGDYLRMFSELFTYGDQHRACA